MTVVELPFRATTAQACHWLAQQTGTPWALARLIENGLTPYVWLDYDADYPELFGDANGGYPAPIFFEGDTQRLAAGSEDVLITLTKDAYKTVAQLKPPGFRRALHELRFLKRDLERLANKLKREAEPEPEPVKIAAAKESQSGINQEQVLMAFASLVKIDLERALGSGGGIFGDDGARVKGSARKSKNKAVWNPVTLALGLNDVYRVPGGSAPHHAHDQCHRKSEYADPQSDQKSWSLPERRGRDKIALACLAQHFQKLKNACCQLAHCEKLVRDSIRRALHGAPVAKH